MDIHFQKMAKYGYIKLNPNAIWQSAPQLVPKDKKKYRATIDLRPLSAATICETWTIINLNAKQANFAGRRCVAPIEFCNAYWQIPINENYRDARGTISPQ